MRDLILIAAAAENNALGIDNKMLWHLPDDFKRFKELTMGHAMIMGRKTFESLPKVLPGRLHIIISRQKYDAPEGCVTVNSLKDAIDAAPGHDAVYVIGGGEIYKLALSLATKVELTRVHTEVDADAYFPLLDPGLWQRESSMPHEKDDRHQFSFDFETWVRR